MQYRYYFETVAFTKVVAQVVQFLSDTRVEDPTLGQPEAKEEDLEPGDVPWA